MQAMSNDAQSRRALITGGASGLGLATAIALRQQGARVAIADIDEAALRQHATAHDLLPVVMDVTSKASVEKGVEDVVHTFGGLDTLVNSAGITRFRLLKDIDEDEWDRVIGVNLKSVYLCARAAAPHLCASGRGRIVSISSDAGKKGFPLISSYCASKAAVIGFSKAIAGELAPFGVTVNCVCPTGVTATAMGQQVLDYLSASSGSPREQILASRSAGVPVGRMGTAEDVVNAITFLLSDASSFITGESINVDGGVLGSGVIPGVTGGAS